MNQKKEAPDKESLMETYSDYILSKGERPINVYVFAKENNLSEGDFYEYFAGFEAIEQAFLSHFFDRSLELSSQIENYESLETKEKLLNFYFIFFENLNMNRSLVLMIFDTDIKSRLRKLKHLKRQHQDFIHSLNIKNLDFLGKLPEGLRKYQDKPVEEVLWMHFISVLKYWQHDDSAGFEKTDVFIEKSLDTGFEMIESPVIDKLFDLGKFLWKDKI